MLICGKDAMLQHEAWSYWIILEFSYISKYSYFAPHEIYRSNHIRVLGLSSFEFFFLIKIPAAKIF